MIVSQRVVEQQCDKIWNSYCKAQKTEGDKEADRERGGLWRVRMEHYCQTPGGT